ncbi:MAG TPA: hypothetical protein VH372_16430 [Actinospica sp.]|nr:hypothetical protein [Actinospica sp.]
MPTEHTAPAGLAPALRSWLGEQLGSAGPFEVRPVSGGNSNETMLLSAPGQWIMRRLPAVAISPTANNLAREFRALTGRSTAALTFYMTLAFFKLAAIVEGTYARYVTGEIDSPFARALGTDVPRLLRDAAALAERG